MKKKDSAEKESGPGPRTMGSMLWGASALALGFFAFASVVGYGPGDPNVFLPDHVPGARTENPCGWLGANLAYHLVSLYGLAGWVLPLVPVAWGIHVLARRRIEHPWRALAGATLLVWALAALCGTVSHGGGWLYDAVENLRIPAPAAGAGRAGGLLGIWSADWMLALAGSLGSYFLIAGILFLALVLLAERLVDWLLTAIGRAALELVRRASGGRLLREAPGSDPASAAFPEESASAGSPRGRSPSVRATFGQPEAELRKYRAATAAAEPAPVIKIARVTEPALATPPAVEAEREKREIAALVERAAGASAAAIKPDKVERKRPEPAAAKPPAEPKPEPGREKQPAAAPTAAAPAAAPAAGAAAGEPVIRQMSDAVNTPAKVMKAPPAARPAAPARRAPARIQYRLPEVELLDKVENHAQVTNEVLARRGGVLTEALKEFKIATRLVSIDRGPAVTIYELELAPGVRVQRVMELADNLAMAMRAPNVRIIAPIPGKDSIGIEIPNTEREVVRLRPLLESKEFRSQAREMAIPIVMGRDAAGAILMEDLTRMPHLLVAGATGSGKSVCLNSFISTVLMTKSPAEVRLLLVDPKMVEMASYKGIPHLVAPVVTDMKRAVSVFEWALRKMDERYEMLSLTAVRDIARFNRVPPAERAARAEAAGDEEPERFHEQMAYLVIIIDELADLMMLAGKEIELAITRLAQKSRGVGIHIILATQRPSVDVVTGLIKANMPARVAFQVCSKVDSRTIIDQNGAEKLMGMGDMLYLPPTSAALVRAKGTYVSDEEVTRIVECARRQAEPEFAPDLESALVGEGGPGDGDTADFRDDLYDEAVRVVLETHRGSVSLLQRRLGVGYTRAAKLIDMMAERGILGPYRGSKPRDILVTLEQWEAAQAEGEASAVAPAKGGVAGQRADERGARPAAADEAAENQPEESDQPYEAVEPERDDEAEGEAELASSESQRTTA